jgi:prolipoprotein diacylglyceryltransferase
MDQQLAELNKEHNSFYQEQKKRYDRTMFAGIFLSILGASVGYYVIQHV